MNGRTCLAQQPKCVSDTFLRGEALVGSRHPLCRGNEARMGKACLRGRARACAGPRRDLDGRQRISPDERSSLKLQAISISLADFLPTDRSSQRTLAQPLSLIHKHYHSLHETMATESITKPHVSTQKTPFVISLWFTSNPWHEVKFGLMSEVQAFPKSKLSFPPLPTLEKFTGI